jgi:hypothetical protein
MYVVDDMDLLLEGQPTRVAQSRCSQILFQNGLFAGIPKWMRSQIGDAQDPSLNPCRPCRLP